MLSLNDGEACVCAGKANPRPGLAPSFGPSVICLKHFSQHTHKKRNLPRIYFEGKEKKFKDFL